MKLNEGRRKKNVRCWQLFMVVKSFTIILQPFDYQIINHKPLSTIHRKLLHQATQSLQRILMRLQRAWDGNVHI